jgi:hypothetical protein
MPLDADYLSSHRLTHAQAAALLGMHPITVSTWESQGKPPIVARPARANLLRPDVETWAASRWRHGEPGWVTISGAVELLGVTRAWVTHFAQRDRLPYERSTHGHLTFRVEQMRVMGQERRAYRQADRGPRTTPNHPARPDPTPEPEPQPERPGEPEPEPAPETPDEEAL